MRAGNINNEEKNIAEENLRKNRKERKKKIVAKKILICVIAFFVLIIGTAAFLLYGPYNGFRDWLITSSMTTMTHQYFAHWFYSDATIEEVMSNNVVIESGENTDLSLINITAITEQSSYENKYEEQILKKDPNNNDYKIIDIKGDGYAGYLAVIYDPSKVKTLVTKRINIAGQYLTKMATDNNAAVAINGGGFYDPGYNSSGGIPLGLTMSDGKVSSYNTYSNNGVGGLIGFTEDDKLVLGRYSKSQALELKIRDCVTFGPFLIVNGKSSFVKGNGGWGKAPRTAIGQRKDGIVLFLVIDGRRLNMPGADMGDLTEIMENYGAYNAANLDGGTSSVMVVEGKMINDPIDGDYKHQTRPIATGFALVLDK